MGCSPWGRYQSDMTERLHFHFPLSTSEAGPSGALCHLLIKGGDRAQGLKQLSSQVFELLSGGDSVEEFP